MRGHHLQYSNHPIFAKIRERECTITRTNILPESACAKSSHSMFQLMKCCAVALDHIHRASAVMIQGSTIMSDSSAPACQCATWCTQALPLRLCLLAEVNIVYVALQLSLAGVQHSVLLTLKTATAHVVTGYAAATRPQSFHLKRSMTYGQNFADTNVQTMFVIFIITERVLAGNGAQN